MAKGGRQIFVMGHPEYDRITLDGEYRRDTEKGMDIQLPKNYYKDNDCSNKPLLMWRPMPTISIRTGLIITYIR